MAATPQASGDRSFQAVRRTFLEDVARRDVPPPKVLSERSYVTEPISPELVLVDPDLAARVRALPIDLATPYELRRSDGLTHAAQRTPYRALPRTPYRAVPRVHAARADGRPRRRRAFKRLSGSLVAISLMAGGVVAASAVSGADSEQPQLAPAGARAEVSAAAPTAKTRARVRPAAKPKPRQRSDSTAPRHSTGAPKRRKQAARRAASPRETNAAVERKLLNLIIQSPAGRLPPVLINRRTGLAKNNLQAVCTRGNDSGSFLCVVKSALHPAAGTVYALYRRTKDGGRFIWYRNRSD